MTHYTHDEIESKLTRDLAAVRRSESVATWQALCHLTEGRAPSVAVFERCAPAAALFRTVRPVVDLSLRSVCEVPSPHLAESRGARQQHGAGRSRELTQLRWRTRGRDTSAGETRPHGAPSSSCHEHAGERWSADTWSTWSACQRGAVRRGTERRVDRCGRRRVEHCGRRPTLQLRSSAVRAGRRAAPGVRMELLARRLESPARRGRVVRFTFVHISTCARV
jgi:hypothetical protein